MNTSKTHLLIGFVTASFVLQAYAEKVLIRSPKPYDKIVNEVQKQGGTVTHQFKYINAIAADVPDATLKTIRAQLPAGAVTKDVEVNAPTVPTDPRGNPLLVEDAADSVAALSGAALQAQAAADPNAYLINNANLNLGAIHGGGVFGQGMRVAVIDSGIRPGFPHIDLDGSVIGGEDFVGDPLGWINSGNNGHGTFVAGMISANVVFTFGTASVFRNAVLAECPGCFLNPPTSTQIPMVGSAPLSSIYALRVFPPSGGTPSSVVIAAMEKVLQLRENFDNGDPETQNPDGSFNALNIAVCNMSLGGPTLYAGRDLEDQLTQAFEQRDVVLVVSAGNAGPSGTTGGGPGTGPGAVTVGASSTAIHERILRDLQFGLGVGPLYRPFSGTQTAFFSSRGPTADGRTDPDVVANGFASFGQGFGGLASINIGSGTSFSAPSVAGVAAVLRQASPGSTGRQVRNALIQTANPALIQDDSGPQDRGRGHVDAGAALALLASGGASDAPGLPGGNNKNVKVNLLQGAGIKSYEGKVTRSATGLKPGERFETYYRVTPNTIAVVVVLSGFTHGPVQNQLFGDDILLAIHSAKTSAIGEGDYAEFPPPFPFVTSGTFVVNNPEEGLMRVTLNGDWTNAGEVGATVTIFSLEESLPQKTLKSKIADGGFHVLPFKVPAGAASLSAVISWTGDWASYPANDIDLFLIDPLSNPNFDGATLNAPERVEVANPPAGDWLALILGYSVNTKGGDKYELRLAVDGKVLK
ncbi:MAG: S8 family serine peptidase [Verrucomicrobia bacterium]|nr:S8 family serine peptidase [Verrucomicrobiota bacterium]